MNLLNKVKFSFTQSSSNHFSILAWSGLCGIFGFLRTHCINNALFYFSPLKVLHSTSDLSHSHWKFWSSMSHTNLSLQEKRKKKSRSYGDVKTAASLCWGGGETGRDLFPNVNEIESTILSKCTWYADAQVTSSGTKVWAQLQNNPSHCPASTKLHLGQKQITASLTTELFLC